MIETLRMRLLVNFNQICGGAQRNRIGVRANVAWNGCEFSELDKLEKKDAGLGRCGKNGRHYCISGVLQNKQVA